MLQMDFFHVDNAREDVKVQFNPEIEESIPMLRESLKWLNLRNALVTFSKRIKNNFYEDCTDRYVEIDAWACDSLAFLWKDPANADDVGRPYENIMVILERLTNQYLIEHEELEQLRKEKEVF